jgi:hypothetical protein
LFDVARSAKGSSDIDESSIINRRKTLQSKIEAFHLSIQSILGDMCWDKVNQYEHSLEDGLEQKKEENGVHQSELSKLWMPSSFGKDQCVKNGWGGLAEEELRLRIGQANELLSKIRLGLGGEATLYRKSIRQAKSQDTSTRARQKVAQVKDTILKHAKSYRHTRNLMVKLDASESTLSKFKPLQDSDLKVSTDFLEENRYGQRNDKLAWFWREGPDDADTNHSWMEECKHLFK